MWPEQTEHQVWEGDHWVGQRGDGKAWYCGAVTAIIKIKKTNKQKQLILGNYGESFQKKRDKNIFYIFYCKRLFYLWKVYSGLCVEEKL